MTLKETIKQLPSLPGVYQYYDKNARLLYVGKAKNLKNRVKSYFSSKLSLRIEKMISQTVSMDYIVVNS
ncbi:MAG: GIY-YIG nuclease family protein, partial [Campylobacterota bacterium]|nr:GIY-YIG nuclease family protein [Campylobacterota bacterium]